MLIFTGKEVHDSEETASIDALTSLISKNCVETWLKKGHWFSWSRFSLGGYRLLKTHLSPHCAEILAVFQARIGRLEADRDHGFWIQLQSILPCCELHGDRTGNQEKLLCKWRGIAWESRAWPHKGRVGKLSAHPKHRRQTLSVRMLKIKPRPTLTDAVLKQVAPYNYCCFKWKTFNYSSQSGRFNLMLRTHLLP